MIARDLCGQLLAEEAERPWGQEYLRSEVDRNPLLGPSFRARAAAVPDFADFRAVLPERTFATGSPSTSAASASSWNTLAGSTARTPP